MMSQDHTNRRVSDGVHHVHDGAYVEAYDNASVKAHDGAYVEAYGSATVIIFNGNTSARAHDNAVMIDRRDDRPIVTIGGES